MLFCSPNVCGYLGSKDASLVIVLLTECVRVPWQ